jgi:hypothetical protein
VDVNNNPDNPVINVRAFGETLEQFLPVLPPDTPCIFSYGQMPVAQDIALETLLGI